MRSLLIAALAAAALAAVPAQEPVKLVTGKVITPQGTHVFVGSFPANMALSPDGRFAVVTNTGFRQFLSVVSTADGRLVSQVAVNGTRPGGGKEGLYWGLALTPASDGGATLYASRGTEDRIAVYALDRNGKLTDTGRSLDDASDHKTPNCPAGIAVSHDGARLFAANNQTDANTQLRGSLSLIDVAGGKVAARVTVPGYPLGVAALTAGPLAGRKVYVGCERDAVVAVVDPSTARVTRTISVGDHPLALLLDPSQRRLYVANAGSDTISVVDTASDRVTQTIPLRPQEMRGLPGAVPSGLALAPDGTRLYAALADMNAVAVVALPQGRLEGYVPTGWYPTSLVVSPDGRRLLVACARGVGERNPNKAPAGPGGAWGTYGPNIIEGCVSAIDVPGENALVPLTALTLRNNLVHAGSHASRPDFRNPGIEHVIYVIKENRTYDQVLGDIPQGDGDPSLCMFPREVTPNQHALAERFVLMDNFYVCAEVSADGWAWSLSGMTSEYAQRNTFYNYGGRGRSYDTEGTNSGLPIDLLGLPDVAKAPSGYLWEHLARSGVSFRNYGCFVTPSAGEITLNGKTTAWKRNVASNRILARSTHEDFLQYDMRYADSEAWVYHNAPAPAQMREYGSNKAPSRITEWRRDYDRLVREGGMPRMMLVRLPRDHTSGTSPNHHSPRAMVADNDFAVGQLVETVSKGPYWKKTAIFIIEDDAQNGQDHIDAHRSTCYVVSPYVRRGTVDHRFYNTDSVLRTMGLLLGIKPLCQFDAIATPFAFFDRTPANDEPYTAILPDRRIVGEVNKPTAYRAADCEKLNFVQADAVDDHDFNDILWHAVMGDRPMPAPKYTLRAHATGAKPRR